MGERGMMLILRLELRKKWVLRLNKPLVVIGSNDLLIVFLDNNTENEFKYTVIAVYSFVCADVW